MADESGFIEQVRQAIQNGRVRLMSVRTDQEFVEVGKHSGWFIKRKDLAGAVVTAMVSFEIPLAALPPTWWLKLGRRRERPLLSLFETGPDARGCPEWPLAEAETVDVLAVCLDEDPRILEDLIFPELKDYPILSDPAWPALRRKWTRTECLTANSAGLQCRLFVRLEAY